MAEKLGSRISVVINTFNEEKNLPYALRSVQTWADEIIVVDMHSEDRTVEIARQFGAKVYFHERMGFVEPARAFAIGQASGDWIMVLDADEIVPEPLSRKLIEIAHGDEGVDAARLPWVNYLLGAAIRHTGWGPSQDC
ncbi:MAG: glycosyltransferase family 2 protein, partial [Terriglobia bacterium]